MKRFGVIADDLTGAMDTGLQFRRLGLRTVVHLETSRVPGEGELPVLDTESRELPPDVAYARVHQAARQLQGCVVYKKIDSTLRGNLGPELDAVLDALALERALVSPAFPAAGRTISEGRLLVQGIPLRQTDFVDDPLCPATDHLPSLLHNQSPRRAGYVSLDTVKRGTEALVCEIEGRSEEILVCDAANDDHLAVIAQAAAALGPNYLACGSAGLAQALPPAFGVARRRPRSAPRCTATGPVLVVAGTRRQATVRQIRRAIATEGAALVEVDPQKLSTTARKARIRAHRRLVEGTNVIVTPAFHPYLGHRDHAVARHLAEIAASLAGQQPLSGLVLTGGATAVAVCHALGVVALEIEEEVRPGIPSGRARGGAWDDRRLITKAGGFGQDDSLAQAIRYLRRGGKSYG